MAKNVLYISYDGMTDPLGQSQVLPYLVNLTKLGYHFHLISCEKEEVFEKGKATIAQICSNNNIDWHPLPYTKKPPIFSTIKDVRAIKKLARKIHQKNGIQLTHCRSYISALIGMGMKQKFGIPFLFDMRGFWPDERVDGKIWNKSKFPFNKVYSFFKNKEKAFLENANHTISLTFNGKNTIHSWDFIKGNPIPISVIPTCADLDHFDFNQHPQNNQLKKEWGIPEQDFVLAYLGSLGTWYMGEEMLAFFKHWQQQKPNSTFLFISKDNPNEIKKQAKSMGIPSDKIVVQGAERSILPEVLSFVDASIFFILPVFSKRASSPTKQAELLGMGIPLICNANVGDTNEILEKEGAGIVLPELNTQTYQNAIQAFDQQVFEKNQLRSIAQKHFSLTGGVKTYAAVYKELIG